MSLKLRELWNECEKMDPFTLKVFLDGLKEIAGTVDERYLKQVAKPCVAQKPSTIRNCGAWEPQEDDLLHQCISSSRNVHQGCIAFASDVLNKKCRTKEAAVQRYRSLSERGKW